MNDFLRVLRVMVLKPLRSEAGQRDGSSKPDATKLKKAKRLGSQSAEPSEPDKVDLSEEARSLADKDSNQNTAACGIFGTRKEST